MNFKPTDQKLFFTKNDPDDPRLGDIVKPFTDSENIDRTFVIQGYPDDEGIKLNGGRLGAAGAPQKIRKALYKMTPALEISPPPIRDLGDLETSKSLKDRHQIAYESVAKLLEKKAKALTFGGGH